ncbi:serine hydrolase [Streptomyces yaizuensis]|uniref:Serine hydrolase n=1 Tax=Streptomyces yaizuensis TaxID=2989713 RepID=A0ABQ5NTV0_9ACTN|nr:serine hydrolase [Streptomyces sp. YSPA8]GLF93605.1 serine hydrolase [Streptomyces sp. YSPA8]
MTHRTHRTHRTHHRIAARHTTLAAAAVATALLAPVAVTATAAPAVAAPAPAVSCTSTTPGLAAKLKKDITAALKNRKGTIALQVDDKATGTVCALRASTKFDSASVVKATVLGVLLQDAQKQKRALTSREKTLAKAMITKSDNASTSTLWKQLGMTKIKRFLKDAGMTQTVPGADNYWGLTQITVRDQQLLLERLTVKNAVLTDASRSYALQLMKEVVRDQRWGTPAGAPSTVSTHVKNGWLSRKTHGWRVHSTAAFTRKGEDYGITVLTHGNATMQDGVNSIQAVSRAIHQGLNPKAPARTAYVPPAVPREAVPATPERPARDAVPAQG